jgi:hypothetical protein
LVYEAIEKMAEHGIGALRVISNHYGSVSRVEIAMRQTLALSTNNQEVGVFDILLTRLIGVVDRRK